MHAYQREFIAFAIANHVLRFGEFTLKSGRVSPYFFNAGLFNSGAQLAQLGRYYAAAIRHCGLAFDLLFGPAYKGIPLACATAIALATDAGAAGDDVLRDVPWAFNRKEIKDHGEGGAIVGAPLAGRVLLIDDVITAGTAIAESMHLIKGAGARAVGVVIALDRQERGQHGSRSATDEVAARYALPVLSIVSLDDLLTYLTTGDDHGGRYTRHIAAINAYRERYGSR